MASGNDAVNSAIEAFNNRLTAVGPKSVLINLTVMIVLSTSTLILFSLLRPTNSVVYAPRLKYEPDDKRPPKIDKGFLSWLQPIWQCKEDFMLERLGLDAVVFLRFQRMLRWMFSVITVLVCAVLIPVNVIYNLREVPSGKRNTLSMLTIQNVDGVILYAHVTITYLIHAIVYAFIFFNYRRIVALRWRYFRSSEYQASLAARSVMVTHVSKRMQSDQGLEQLLGALQIPYQTLAVHIGRRVDELPELIEAHADTVRRLEQVLTTYLRKGTIPAKRPQLTIGGFLGMGGHTYDAIDYLTERIQQLESKIEVVRENIDTRKPQKYGFASFEKVPYAHIVAKKLAHKSFKGARIELAPVPSDLLWDNLAKSDGSRRSARIFGSIILAAVMVLYTIPLVGVSALSNLAVLTVYVPFLRSWSDNSNFTFSAFTGIAPPFLGILLQLLLPMIMRAISKYQGKYTNTSLDRSVFSRYFFFLFVTQFIVFSLIGVIFNLVAEIIIANGSGNFVWSEVSKLPQKILATYLQQSNYWLTYFPLRGFSSIFEIAQLINLFFVWVRSRLFGRTPRQIKEWCKPPSFDYAVYSANACLMVTIALIYSPLAPLVSLLAAAAFFASSIVSKYELLYIFVTKVESGGKMWRMLVNRILAGLFLMQLLMCLTIALQLRYINAVAAAPPLISVLAFKWYLNNKFGQSFRWYLPSGEEVASSKAHHSDERKGRLAKRFGHPSLHADLITPMLHKKVEHLLPQVYRGRMAYTDKSQQSASGTHMVSAGGLTFAAIAQNDLELSRDQYLREQRQDEEGWETSSMASSGLQSRAGVPREAEQKGYFDEARQAYLHYGPGGVSTPSEGFEMSRQVTRESQENLLNYSSHPRQLPTYNAYSARGSPVYGNVAPESRESLDLSAYGQPSLYDPHVQTSTSGLLAYPPQQQFENRVAAPFAQHGRNMSSSSLNSFASAASQAQPSRITSPVIPRNNPTMQPFSQPLRPLPPGAGGYAPRSQNRQ